MCLETFPDPFPNIHPLLLACHGTRGAPYWLFPEAPPDLINFNMGRKRRISDLPKIRPDPKSLALGPLGDTTQGLETKLEPNWSRKEAIGLLVSYLVMSRTSD